jgi:hypothetical protein
MANRIDRWSGKPRPPYAVAPRSYEDSEPCPYCGETTIIIDCPQCGAPNCCKGCCDAETNDGLETWEKRDG